MIDFEELKFAEKQQKLIYAAKLRDISILGIISIILIAGALDLIPLDRPFRYVLIVFASIALTGNAIFGYFFKKGLYLDRVTEIAITGDMIFVTLIVYFTGGVSSFFIVLYIMQIVGTSALGNYRYAKGMAALGTLFYASMALLEYSGLLPHQEFIGLAPLLHKNFTYILVSISTLTVFMYLGSWTSGYLSENLKIKEQKLERATRDLESLYTIGKTITGTILIDELLKSILGGITHGLGYKKGSLYLINEKGELETFFSDDKKSEKFELDLEQLKRLALTKEPYFNGKLGHIPIMIKDKVIGMLFVEAGKEKKEKEELDTLKALAQQTAVAIENARLYQKTELLSKTDGLTGLYNHRYFIERLDEESSRAQRYNHSLSLLIVDIDHFKMFNDSYGHQTGDKVLQIVARILRENLREIDIPARYGGEEFTIILPHTNSDSAYQLAERIRKKVNKNTIHYQDNKVNVTVSVGVSTLFSSDNVISSQDLLRYADKSLYKAKEMGRNQVCMVN